MIGIQTIPISTDTPVMTAVWTAGARTILVCFRVDNVNLPAGLLVFALTVGRAAEGRASILQHDQHMHTRGYQHLLSAAAE